MRAVGYVRTSPGSEVEGISLAAQETKIRQFADLYDLKLIGIASESQSSAKTLNRPRLQYVLEILQANQADGIIVAKLDRLTRSVADLATLLDGYFSEKAGRQLWSVADPIDTRTAAGRMVLNILMSVAQWEREAIGERTRDALHHKKRNNERVGQLPYGSKVEVRQLDKPTSKGKTTVQILVPDPAETEAIDCLKRWKLDTPHISLSQLARKLDAAGFPTKSGRAWNRGSVRNLLVRMHIPTDSRPYRREERVIHCSNSPSG